MDYYSKKSRGVNHLKNKLKYKNRNKAVPQPKNVQRPVLESNWNEDIVDSDCSSEEDESKTNLTDFNVLSQAPLTLGSHFQFKSDIADLSENDVTIESDPLGLFNLDLNSLSLALETIPFYERYSIPKEYFSNEKIKKMDNEAKINLNAYSKNNDKTLDHSNKLLSVLKHSLSEKHDLIKESGTVDQETKTIKVNPDIKSIINEDESFQSLLENINISGQQGPCKDLTMNNQTESNEGEDLEEWLDDILNT